MLPRSLPPPWSLLLVFAEPQALKGQQVRLVRPGLRVLRVKLVLLALKVQQALTERMAQLELQVLRVRLDHKVQQAQQAQLGQLEQLGQTALMEQLQLLLLAQLVQARLAQAPQLQIQELLTQLFLRFQFHKELQARLGQLVRLGLMAPMARLDLKALPALLEQLVQQEQPDPRVLQEQMELMALQP